ncbi:MAG: translocation/assembly module TamB domain-containing protein [Bacteroidales bacterium]|nr:translocation/assembly module TamB domain-containing protein [Bacteroidales bacterium]
MKVKAGRILGIVFGSLLLLMLGVMLAAEIPAVQTFMAKNAAEKLEQYINGDVSIGSVKLKPFDAVVLHDITIIDTEPYDDPEIVGYHPVDTFARIGTLTAHFSLKGLFKKEGLHFRKVTLDDSMLDLVIEQRDAFSPYGNDRGTTLNLQRIFKLVKKDKKKEPGDIFDIGRVKIRNFNYRMDNPKSVYKRVWMGKDTTDLKRRVDGELFEGLDWDDMDIMVNIDARNLSLSKGYMSGIVDHLDAVDKSGFNLKHLSASTVVGGGKTEITDLHIVDDYSDVKLDYLNLIGTPIDYREFVDRVRIQGSIQPGSVLDFHNTLAYFAPAMRGRHVKAEVSGVVDGPVSDLTLDGVTFRDLNSGTGGTFSGKLSGLTDKDMRINTSIRNFKTTTKGLGEFIREFAPKANVDLSKYLKGQTITLDADLNGTLKDLAVNGTARTAVGSASVDGAVKNLSGDDPVRIIGTLSTSNLDVGAVAGIKAVGPVTARAKVDAKLGKNPDIEIQSLDIDRLSALGYDYSDIHAKGVYTGKSFDGRIVSNDPNLNLLFQGKFNTSPKTENAAYQFYADVGYANLQALNLYNKSQSRVSLRTSADFIRVSRGDLIGDVTLADIILEDEDGVHEVGDVSIQSHSNDKVSRMKLSSDFAEGTFVGSKSIGDFVKDLKKVTISKELPSVTPEKEVHKDYDGGRYDLEFIFHDSTELLSFFSDGAYVEDGSKVNISLSKEGILNGKIVSGRVAYDNKYLKDLSAKVSNAGDVINAEVDGSELKIGSITMKNPLLAAFVNDDHVGLSVGFDNETEAENKADLFVEADFSRDERDSLLIKGSVLPSNLYYEGTGWGISSDPITIKGHDIDLNNLVARSDEQTIIVDGGLSRGKADTLSVSLDHFDVSVLNSLIKQELNIQGLASGEALLISPSKPKIGVLAAIAVDSTYVAGERLGTLNIGSEWNKFNETYDLTLNNNANGRRNIDATGFIQPSTKQIGAGIALSDFDLTIAGPFLKGVFSNMDGKLGGYIGVDGTLDKINIASKGTNLKDGKLTLDYTKVPYFAEGPFSLTENALDLTGINLKDRYQGTGKVSGGLMMNRLKDPNLKIDIDFRDMECLATGAEKEKEGFYGNIFATGDINITGPLDDILLDIDATTARKGAFHIPLSNGSSARTSDLLTFYELPEEEVLDPYDLLVERTTSRKKKKANIEVKLRANATPSTSAIIEVDRTGGTVLTTYGHGVIEMHSNSKEKLFSLGGSYGINSGTFKLNVLGMINREFTISDGSTVRFNGPVMETDLDINAVYTTKTSLSTLLADTTSVATRRTVNCGINITEKLSNPKISFSIDIPDLDPMTASQVDAALNTQDKIEKQLIYLLISNNFMPDESSGVSIKGKNILFSNVSSIMSNQINNIFQKLGIPLDLGLNYQSNDRGNDIFDVAVSTQLFNNMVVVNGTIGNRQYSTSNGSSVAGNIEIEVKLNRQGTVRVTVFSHSADNYTSYLDNTQRNGVGIAYQKEFNTFRQFFQEMFMSKKKRQALAMEPRTPVEQVSVSIDEKGKVIKE